MPTRLLALAAFVSLAACAQPREVRTLATETAPFVAVTHGTAPAVEQAFQRQSARVREERLRLAGQAVAARAEASHEELLWSLDEPAFAAERALMARVRSEDAALRAPPPAPLAAPPPAPPAGIGPITKLTALLRDVAAGGRWSIADMLGFVQATDREMQKLQDAAARAD
jgi:hypothetical protein